MVLQVNGKLRELPDGITIRDLLQILGVRTEAVAVERNRRVVPRADHATTILQESDVIEVVTFVGGG